MIASFDIGKNNFAFCVEKIEEKELRELKEENTEKVKYNKDGTPTENMQALLQKIYENGEIILHKNVNLTAGCDKSKTLDPITFHNMTDLLDEYEEIWKECEYIVIEGQMGFGKMMNLMAVKLGQHCFSYFAIKYGREKKIIEFPAYHKTCVLGAQKILGKKGRYKSMAKPARKKWAVEKATEILTNRGEEEELKKVKKKDDLADTFLQLQAFKYKEFVE